eukprot:g19414.t1
MIREKLLAIKHVPGRKMFADGYTKDMVAARVFLLHLAANFGLLDRELLDVVHAHIKEELEREQEMEALRLGNEEPEEKPEDEAEFEAAIQQVLNHDDGMILSTSGATRQRLPLKEDPMDRATTGWKAWKA